MGRGSKTGERKSRSKRLGLGISVSAVQRIVNRLKPFEKRVGSRSVAHLAAQIDAAIQLLARDVHARAKEKQMINVQHLAQSLNDPTTDFHGLFANRVAGVFTVPDESVDDQDAIVHEEDPE